MKKYGVQNDFSIYGRVVYVSRYGLPASQALLVNNTIADNGDSGVMASYCAVLTMTNNLIVSHTVGPTNTHPASSTISADTNLFWKTGDPITGTKGIRQDPLLTADCHPGSSSPAIDAGLTISWLAVRPVKGQGRQQSSRQGTDPPSQWVDCHSRQGQKGANSVGSPGRGSALKFLDSDVLDPQTVQHPLSVLRRL